MRWRLHDPPASNASMAGGQRARGHHTDDFSRNNLTIRMRVRAVVKALRVRVEAALVALVRVGVADDVRVADAPRATLQAGRLCDVAVV